MRVSSRGVLYSIFVMEVCGLSKLSADAERMHIRSVHETGGRVRSGLLFKMQNQSITVAKDMIGRDA